jgi:hypothetical protein
MTRHSTWLVTLLLIASACGRHDTTEDAPIQRDFEFDRHRLTATLPASWQILDQGAQKRFRKNDSELVLRSLGPADAHGITREVQRARDLWEAGRAGESQLRLDGLHVPADLFFTAEERQAFQSMVTTLSSRTAVETPFGDVEPVFLDILARADALQARDLTQLAEWGLTVLGHDQRRDVKSRRPVEVGGREALEIETWNRLSHTNPQRALFVPDDGELLALYTPREADAESVKGFESIRDSLHFPEVDASDSRRQ